MHPAGIKFGLSYDLLQLRGADVVASDRLFESISAQARRRIKVGTRVPEANLWDHVVNHGLRRVLDRFQAPHSEFVPFFTGLDRILGDSLLPIAARVGIGRKIGRAFMPDKPFDDEFQQRIAKLKLGQDLHEVRKLFFRECWSTVRMLCEAGDPENLRHADFLALHVFNLLKTSGSIEIIARLRTAKPRSPRTSLN